MLGPGTELPEVRDLPAVAFTPHPGQLLLYERGDPLRVANILHCSFAAEANLTLPGSAVTYA